MILLSRINPGEDLYAEAVVAHRCYFDSMVSYAYLCQCHLQSKTYPDKIFCQKTQILDYFHQKRIGAEKVMMSCNWPGVQIGGGRHPREERLFQTPRGARLDKELNGQVFIGLLSTGRRSSENRGNAAGHL